MQKIIVVAGATGNLGARIVKALLQNGADVRACVRAGTDPEKIKELEKLGVVVYPVNMLQVEEVAKVCTGASCVVSVLSGLREVIIDVQKVLLDAAVQAGVPRFIPSDFSMDFTGLPAGRNRNLDLRREFHTYLEQAPIAATTIFNGAFTELTTGDMPLILLKIKRILAWGNPAQRLYFTSMDDTAAFTAQAAMDDSTPRYLRIAGDQPNAPELAAMATELTGNKFSLLRPGGLGLLSILIRVTRTLAPGDKNELYPAWQGMQYMRDMLDERAQLTQLDNDRYAHPAWTTVRDMLAAHLEHEAAKPTISTAR